LSIIPNLWFNGADIMIALGTLERLLEILGKKEK
jgi:hypothetical protein